MRSIVLTCLLMMSFGLPLVHAQEASEIQTPVNLSVQQSIPELGLVFSYPEGWTVDQSSGLTILADPADLTAATDNNPATRAASPFISLDILPLGALGIAPLDRLDKVSQTVSAVLGFTPQDRFELPVVARRSITLFGSDANGDYGYVTFWVQDESLVLFVFSAPSAADVQTWSSTWKSILASVTPENTLPLTEIVNSQFLKTTIHYPSGWTMFDGSDRFGLFETSSDRDLWIAGQDVYMENVAITALYQSVKELVDAGVLSSEDNLEELLVLNSSFLGWQNPQVTEGIVFGEPAFIVQTVNPNSFYVYAVMGFVDGNVYLIHAAAPNAEDVEAFKATFDLMMMQFNRN